MTGPAMARPPLIDERPRVLGVFAHPDDEAYFAAGTLATYAAAGASVHLVTLTAGEAMEPAERRLATYAASCAALGVRGEAIAPGRWRDAGRAGGPGTLAGAPLGEVVEAVAGVLAAYGPDLVVGVDADGVTGHPDHVRAHDALVAAGPRVPALLACVDAAAVRRAVDELGALAPGQPIGSGGVRGVPRTADLLEVGLDPAATAARAAALDAYQPGLGTAELAAVIDPGRPVGDGVVLRAVMDAAGTSSELFRVS